MKLPLYNDKGRLRWAIISDDLTGTVEYGLPLTEVIKQRAQVVIAICEAAHGDRKWTELHHSTGLYRHEILALAEKGWGMPHQIKQLDLAFQNCRQRIRLAAK